MKIIKPTANSSFTITATPDWPSIVFETDGKGAHIWHWTIAWGNYTKSGKANTPGNSWDAKSSITNLGGTLTVRAEANKMQASVAVKIKATNPSKAQAEAYLTTKANAEGFGALIEHENKFKHVNISGEPVKSFDNGYGMCQITSPAPKFEEVWNWKMNIDAGVSLYQVKRTAAVAYLATKGAYTTDQLKYETVCRWNGGAYHVWDAANKQWIRPANIVCDSKTGNIGWDMSDPSNADKTEAQLHARDSASYSKAPATGAHWRYIGVCYADAILG